MGINPESTSQDSWEGTHTDGACKGLTDAHRARAGVHLSPTLPKVSQPPVLHFPTPEPWRPLEAGQTEIMISNEASVWFRVKLCVLA